MEQVCSLSPGTTAVDLALSRPVSLSASSGVALYSGDGSDEHIAARLVHREPGLFRLLVANPVPTGKRLIMVDASFRNEIEVDSCCEDGTGKYLLECLVLACREGTIRQEWRMPVDMRARVSVPVTGATLQVRVRNMSPFGMGMEVPETLAVGTAVIVDTKDGFGYGEVRYCRKDENGIFFAGLYLREYVSKPPSRIRLAMLTPMRRWLRRVTTLMRPERGYA